MWMQSTDSGRKGARLRGARAARPGRLRGLEALPHLKAVRMGLLLWAVLLLCAAFPILVAAQPPEPQPPPKKPSALRGQGIFESRCVRCHGTEGKGDGPMVSQLPAPPPSFADVAHMRQVTPADYFDIITNGRTNALMPPWKDALSLQERWDVLFYVWSLGTDAQRIQTGQAVYQRECATCHADDGSGVPTADLSDLRTTLHMSQADLVQAIRKGHDATGWTDKLTDEEHWAVADYVRTFVYEPTFVALSATGEGVIRGKVVQGTPNGPTDFKGLSVTVFPFVGEKALTPITVTTQADGTFEVTDLPTSDDRRYGLQVEYKGIRYLYPELISFKDAKTVTPEVKVYETTRDPSAIHVERHHLIIDFTAEGMRVAELYIFRNAGDRTFVGDGETLRLPLPANAEGVRFDDPRMERSTRLQDHAVVDTLPVLPGTRQVLLSYQVPYQGESATFTKEIAYPTASMNVLVADVGVKVTAEGFTQEDPVTTQDGTRFLNYTRTGMAPGSQLVLELSNLPRPGGPRAAVTPDRSATLRWLGLGLAVLAVAFGAAYPALRPRLLLGEGAAAETALLRRRRQVLLQEIADLDDAFEAGEVEETEYRRTRATLKAELIEIMQQMQKSEEEAP